MIKILAIDDNNENLITLNTLLKDYLPDSVMLTALSGREGISTAKSEDPDVIILDILMPETDGYEVCRLIKQDETLQNIPVVFLTAVKESKESRIKAIETGADAFLFRPIEASELITQIRAMVKIKAAHNHMLEEKEQLSLMVAARTRELEQNGVAMLKLLEKLQAEIETRKNTDAALRESEEKFRVIFKNSSSAIAIIEPDTTISMVNDAYCQLSGYKEEDVVGMSWTKQIMPEDLERLKEYNRRRLIDPNAAPERYEFKFFTKDGTAREAMMSISMIQSPLKFIASFVDITESKKAEMRLKESYSILNATLESTADGLLVIDRNGTVVKFNQAFLDQWHIPDSIVETKDDDKILSFVMNQLKDPEEFISKVRWLYNEPEKYSEDILEFKDGRLFERHSRPQFIGQEIVGRVWSFRDITKRIKIQAIQQAVFQISESVQSSQNLDELYGSIHDIIAGLMPAGNFYIALYDASVDKFHFPYSRDEYDDDEATSISPGKTLTAYVFRTGKPLLATPQIFDELIRAGEVELVGAPSEVWMGAPLKTQQGEIIGVIAVQDYHDASRIQKSDMEILMFVSTQVAIAIERKQVEEALKKSEAVYRNLVEKMPDGVYKTSHSGKIIEMNSAMINILGYDSKEEIMKVDIPSTLYFDPADREEKTQEGTRNDLISYRMRKKDGSEVWVEDHGWYTYDESGEILTHEGVIRDITGRKLEEEKARQHLYEQNIISEISRNLVSMTDKEAIYEYIGQQITNLAKDSYIYISAYNPENKSLIVKYTFNFEKVRDLLNMNFGMETFRMEAFIKNILPEELKLYKSRKLIHLAEDGLYIISSRRMNKDLCNHIEKMLGIKSVYTMGFTWGDKLYGNVTILSLVNDLPEKTSLIETIVNYAAIAIQRIYTQEELIRSEKKYRSLVETSPDGIIMTDREGNLFSFNQKVVDLFGYEDANDMNEHVVKTFNLMTERDHERAVQNIMRRFSGEKYDIEEYNMLRKDGSEFPAEINSSVISDMFGDPSSIMSIIRDITYRKIAIENQNRYTEHLRNYAAHNDKVREQERINLARDLHDILGSSLAGLKMELAILKNYILQNEKITLNENDDPFTAMNSLIDDSVGLMRKMVKELRPGILDELGIVEAIRWYAMETEKRSAIRFTISATRKEISIPIKDADIIFRIFQEIVTNIVRHSGATNVSILIRLNKEKFLLQVSDNGKGVSHVDLHKTDAFGIMSMKERTLLLDGKLDINGTEGKGTTVTIEIPIKTDP